MIANTHQVRKNNMLSKNICGRHGARKEKRGSYYLADNKRFQICDVYIKWNNVRCPWCCSVLRTKHVMS
jgi:hypothetical protein